MQPLSRNNVSLPVLDAVSDHINGCCKLVEAVAAFVIGYLFGFHLVSLPMLYRINVMLLGADRHSGLRASIAAHMMGRDVAARMARGEV